MYNKIFTKILDSSIWLESDTTRIVWLTFIAAMDEMGFVAFASSANVAHRARVSLEDANKAIKILESPDSNSGDPEHEGRRIERVDGGWIVLNASKYREMVSKVIFKEKTRERVRRFREKKKQKRNASVTLGNAKEGECNAKKLKCNASVTQSYAEAYAKKNTLAPEVAKKEKTTVKEKNPIWDSLCENFGLKPVTLTEKKSLGAIVRDLKLKQAAPEQISEKMRIYHRKFPGAACTPRALLKHWDILVEKLGRRSLADL